MNKRVKRAIQRSRLYYSMGISIIGLPLTFLGFSRNLYSLIDKLPFMDVVFPTFQRFLLIGGVSLIPVCGFAGWLWMSSPFWKEEKRGTAEKNPLAFELAPGRDSILYFGNVIGQNNMLRVFKTLGTITDEESAEFERYLELMEHLGRGGSLRK